MAVEVASRPSLPQRLTTFYHDVAAEMRKVVWPDRPQVQQATIGIIAIVLLVGAVIALLDVAIQNVFVRWIPALVGGR